MKIDNCTHFSALAIYDIKNSEEYGSSILILIDLFKHQLQDFGRNIVSLVLFSQHYHFQLILLLWKPNFKWNVLNYSRIINSNNCLIRPLYQMFINYIYPKKHIILLSTINIIIVDHALFIHALAFWNYLYLRIIIFKTEKHQK